MNRFSMNGYLWRILFVDPNHPMLVDRTGTRTIGTTDPKTKCIYISNRLGRTMLERVLIHEIGHCALISFGLLDDIHRMVYKRYWTEAEEWVCNFIADYGSKIFSIAYSFLGQDAFYFVPYEIEKMMA